MQKSMISSVNLKKISFIELQHLLDRQNAILANKRFLSKLPDKGEKLKIFHQKIVNEITIRKEVDSAARLISNLNIASRGKDVVNQLEWTGQSDLETNVIELDSDDETDPLKILSQPTGTGCHKKKIVHLPSAKSLTVDEANETSSELTKIAQVDGHTSYIINKVESNQKENGSSKKEPFKPYKTAKSKTTDFKIKEKGEPKPPDSTNTIKMLTIAESFRLQREQAEILQKIKTQHAVEKFHEFVRTNNKDLSPSSTYSYRDINENNSFSSDDKEDEEELCDADDTV